MIAAGVLMATFLLLGLPAAVVLIPWRLATGDILPLYRAALAIVHTGFRLAGIRVVVEGVEHIPQDRACVFMSNHISNLDPPVLLPAIPGRASVFLKQSLMKIPVLGWAMRLADFIPVRRDGSVQSAQENVRRASLALERGIHIMTFVEGTRSRDGRLLPFKKGPFYLAMETGAPCVPVTISGTETMMRKGSLRIFPGVARIVFHAPIQSAEYREREALMTAVRRAIASRLPESMR